MPKTPSGASAGVASVRPDTPVSSDSEQSRPSGFLPAPAAPVAATDSAASASVPANPRSPVMNRPEKLDQTKDDALDSAAAVKDKAVAETAKLGDDAKRVRDDAVIVGEDLAALAREAVSALQRVADDLAAKAGTRAEEAVEAAKGVGVATVENVSAVASDARQRAEGGVEALSQSVARNPLTSVAIAAGVGMIVGMINRSDRR